MFVYRWSMHKSRQQNTVFSAEVLPDWTEKISTPLHHRVLVIARRFEVGFKADLFVPRWLSSRFLPQSKVFVHLLQDKRLWGDRCSQQRAANVQLFIYQRQDVFKETNKLLLSTEGKIQELSLRKWKHLRLSAFSIPHIWKGNIST